MSWDFLSPELRHRLRSILDSGDELVRAGVCTREQAENMVRKMIEVALSVQRGDLTEDEGQDLIEQFARAQFDDTLRAMLPPL